MNLTTNINTFGLILDIVGVLLLFEYGLPVDISRSGRSVLADETVNEAEVQKANYYNNMQRCAVVVLVLGFLLQIVSNYL